MEGITFFVRTCIDRLMYVLGTLEPVYCFHPTNLHVVGLQYRVYEVCSETLNIFTIDTIQIPLWIQYQFVHCIIQFVNLLFTISKLTRQKGS